MLVSELLGHKDVTTRRDVFAAILPDMQDHGVDVLVRLTGRAARGS